ncbi:MAG: hypothetical protein PHU80_12125 [Kiritimatiellae bacterium]|nr:hypothetical protein [Kiritimatiellia bacterium]
MSGVRSELCASGKITSGIAEKQHLDALVDFIYRTLPFWRDDPERPEADRETVLNETLCGMLNTRAKREIPCFHFIHEAAATGRRSMDMALKPDEKCVFSAREYTRYDTVLAIECKRLPAPSRDREREYVSGGDKTTGGIQRFKLSEHGAGLPVAVMVGYVQHGTPQTWLGTINRWIIEFAGSETDDGLSWSEDEKLAGFKNDRILRTARARSRHPRAAQQDHRGDHIQIEHLWVDMSEAEG